MSSGPGTAGPPEKRLSLGAQTLGCMLVGALIGLMAGERASVLQPLGDLFIRILMMVAVPLVFFNLLAGLTSLTDFKTLGRVGSRILLFYLSTSAVALALGVVTTSLLRPGVGMTSPELVIGAPPPTAGGLRALAREAPQTAGKAPGLSQVLLDLIPSNAVQAFASGHVAQIVVFAVFLGIATLKLPSEERDGLIRAYDLVASLLRKLVTLVLHVAPFGIGALTATTVGQYGAKVFGPLGVFIGGLWAADVVMVLLYLALLHAFTRGSPARFLVRTAPLYATTAATCSSLASLVVSMEIAEKRLGIPRAIYAFTLPLGVQMKKDGTSIMLAGLLVFTAQAAGVSLDPSAYLTVALLGLLLTVGSGGVPGGGLVAGFMYVEAFHLPLEIAAIVGGVYRLIDVANTTVNCMGGLVGTTLVASLEVSSNLRSHESR